MYFGALFFQTVSDGVLTVDRVHPRSDLGIRDTTTDEAVWSADATELIKLGKDMIVASPESYLCFVNHFLEETIIDDPMENIAEPPAKVAKLEDAMTFKKFQVFQTTLKTRNAKKENEKHTVEACVFPYVSNENRLGPQEKALNISFHQKGCDSRIRHSC